MPTDWEKMAALTGPICKRGKDECAQFKNRPYRCCDIEHCRMAGSYAKTLGIILQPTGNAELPYMGDNGCVVPPALRPVCTMHVCTISYAEKSHIEHDEEKTRAYFKLREGLESK